MLWCACHCPFYLKAVVAMTETVRELQEKVLTLPTDERAALAEKLLTSLEPKSSAQRAWSQLASRRREDVFAVRMNMVPDAEAVARIRAKVA